MEPSSVKTELNQLRIDEEVRSILLYLEGLISLSPERKARWIWELVQNAKDCRFPSGVNIIVALEKNRVSFQHDGKPFQLKELLALVRRTSTKSLNGEEGNTGKFGTGFITTHVLNKKVNVQGFLNNAGLRQFELHVNREFDTLPALKTELDKTYDIIDQFSNLPTSSVSAYFTKFIYNLPDDHIFGIAQQGILDLERNLPFTLLINPEINSVRISDSITNSNATYSLDTTGELSPTIRLAKLLGGPAISSKNEKGIAFRQFEDNLSIGIPVEKIGEKWFVSRMKKQSRIFKEFPLIGTEEFHIPFLIHSKSFEPPESRDGIRTLKEKDEIPDKHADQNRDTLLQYLGAAKEFFKELFDAGVDNIHLLAESGLPEDSRNYTSLEWYSMKIQEPYRTFLRDFSLVKTVSGKLIPINKCKIPSISTLDENLENEFYQIASVFINTECPDQNSIHDWRYILSQNKDKWGNQLDFSVEELVKSVSQLGCIQNLNVHGEETPVQWLNKLINFVNKTGKGDLEKFPIHPNQKGFFKPPLKLFVIRNLSPELKSISEKLGRPLDNELLSDEIENEAGIAPFEMKQFLIDINSRIGKPDYPEKATSEQIEAVFQLVCLFRESNVLSPKRETWYQLINELLPALAPQKSILRDIPSDYSWDPPEKFSLKYVCLLIRQLRIFPELCYTYFENNAKNAFDWYNRFLDFVWRNEDNREMILKYPLIPTIDGAFRMYNESLFRREKPEEFDPLFNELSIEFLQKNPATRIVFDDIKSEVLKVEPVSIITKEIDSLFSNTESEEKVKDNGEFAPLYHKLNAWASSDEKKAESLFPIFSSKRPVLSMKVFGPEASKKLMKISELGLDKLEALAMLNLTQDQIEQLDHACKTLGIDKVISIAKEKISEEEEIAWKKKMGAIVEAAFRESIKDIQPEFHVDNPDYGKDYTLKLPDSNKQPFSIEIKGIRLGKQEVKMSKKQGETAIIEHFHYSLCVLYRRENSDDDDKIDKDYFKQNARFVTNIGQTIGDRLDKIHKEISLLDDAENEDVAVHFDNKKFSVYVRKKIWDAGISFDEFVNHLKNYFKL